MVSEFGPLTDRPLLFRGRAGYDQIRLEITPGWTKYRLDFDVASENLENSDYGFTASLDTPQVRTLNLHGWRNDIRFFPSPTSPPRPWRDGEKSHFTIEADLAENRWGVWQDGIQILDVPLNAPDLKSIRFSLSPWIAGAPDDLSVGVAVDNIKVLASEPIALTPPAYLTVVDPPRVEGISLSWPEVPFADSYHLYRNTTDNLETAKLLVETGGLAYIDVTAELDTRYYYWLKSGRGLRESTDAVSANSVLVEFPPQSLTLSRGERSDGIALSWRPGTKSSSYRIYRADSNEFALATWLGDTQTLSYLDMSAVAGKKYYFWVKSVRASGPSKMAANGYGARGFFAVDGLTITPDGKSGNHRLSWNPIEGASHYVIYRGVSPEFSEALSLGRVPVSRFNDHTAPNGTTHYYWVVAGSSESEWMTQIPPSIGVKSEVQPDLWAENKAGAEMGKGIANNTGLGQTLSMVERNRKSMSAQVGIATLGLGSGHVLLSGSGGNRHFKTTYHLNGNVTAKMVTGRLSTPADPDRSSMKVMVSPQRSVRLMSKPKSFRVQVRGASLQSPDASDLVILRSLSLPGGRL